MMQKSFKILLLTTCLCLLSNEIYSLNNPLEKKHVDLLILGGIVVTMDAQRSLFENGAVAVDQGTIIEIGDKQTVEAHYSAARVIDAQGKAIIPGLINGHTHLAMSLFRGIADDLDLHDWLNNYIFPAETRNVDEAFVRAGTRLGLAELIKGGTTTFVDMYFFEDAVAEETAKAGLRGIVGQGVLDFPTPDSQTFEESLSKAQKLIKKWHHHPLITPAIAPHAPYTVCEEHLKLISALSSKMGAPILIHISETQEEVARLEQEKGLSPIAYLEQIGLLNNPVIAAHMVFPKKEEISILKRYQVGVIHNIHSNMKLASGIAPVPDLLDADISIGLGTDGAASNNDLSLWEEMDTTAKIHKVTSKDPRVLSALQTFEMATIRGAKALRMEKSIGSIEVGKKADIVLVDLDSVHQIPSYNIYSTLVYATKASDVNTVIVDGKLVMLQHTLLTLDELSIKKDTFFYCDKIKRSLQTLCE